MNINKNLMSRNHTALKRTKADILYIVMHYVGALGDAKANTDYYKSTDVGASADFWVGHDGAIWQGNDYYNYYSWHCGGGRQGSAGGSFYGKCTNRNSIGIEMCVKKRSAKTMNATDKDWYFEDATVVAAVELVKSLMAELDIDIDHVIRHYDVNGKICPNPFVYDTGKYSWADFKKLCSGASNAATEGTQTSEFSTLTETQAAARLLEICRPVAEKYHLLPSVATAQCILESGYCKTELAKSANNVCGMKCTLSGNTWPGSTWDGVSEVNIRTAEQDKSGNTYYINADFRKYPCIEDSVADRCAYLIGAKNGNNLRYAGITECADYKTQIQLIKNGGYATDVNYVTKICSIIQRFGLDKYDSEVTGALQAQYYVRKSWPDKTSQLGAYSVLENAKKQVDTNWRYNVYDATGKEIYNGTRALIDRAVSWAVGIAADNSHGYNNSGNGWGPDEYNCIGLVMRAYKAAGNDPGVCNIDQMPEYLKSAGFEDVTSKVNLKTGKGAVKGDVFWMLDNTGKHGHTEMFCGDGQLVGARGNYDGKTGDSSGKEIAVNPYSNMSWQRVFRLPGGYTAEVSADTSASNTYKVQIGAYTVKTNAEKRLTAVKAAGFDAIIKHEDGYWRVQCGAFSEKKNAEALQKRLKRKGYTAIIKEY